MTYANTHTDTYIGAIALMTGAFLNMVRMFPIYLHEEVGFTDYPPTTLEETVSIAQLSGYYISHIMVFFATPLFVVGFYAIYKALLRRGANLWLTMSLFGFVMGQVFYTLGVSIHGLILPEMAHEYTMATSAEQTSMASIFELNHLLATGFGGLGFAFILVSTGIFGLFLRSTSPVLGVIGVLIGAIAFVGYATGVLQFMLFNNFQTTAGFVTVMFVFYFVLGISTFLTSRDTE